MIKPVSLGQFPTPIEFLKRFSLELGCDLYLKRDDFSGIELSGNKVRKLEYAMAQALENRADVVMTAGALQSNHCRATVTACRKLGLNVHLFLFGDENDERAIGGNFFLVHLMGAQVTYLPRSAYANYLEQMHQVAKDYEKHGKKTYIIPIGASNGIGNFGYIEAYEEIIDWEKKNNINFDTIVCAVGSGGTYAGLWLGSYLNGLKHKVVGISVGGEAHDFKEKIQSIIKETVEYKGVATEWKNSLDVEEVLKYFALDACILDKYQGKGYAIPYDESLKTIELLARKEGVILDPVYTGKAFHGLLQEVEKKEYGIIKESKKILFIHTGGIFGLSVYENILLGKDS